jgi:hypothetical protein
MIYKRGGGLNCIEESKPSQLKKGDHSRIESIMFKKRCPLKNRSLTKAPTIPTPQSPNNNTIKKA